MSAAYPSGSNTFVKDHQATGGLVVDFSRNVEDFALNRYVQIRPVRKESGYYLEMTVEEAGRVLHSDLADFVWPDGQDRPSHPDGTESFRFREYRTERFDYGFVLGDKAIDQADWDVLESHGRIKAQQAMTARTQRAVAAMTDAAAYDASHVADVADIDGATGPWHESTVETQDVRRSLAFAASLIRKDTLGVVKTRDLRLVLGPDVARQIALAPEIVEYVAHSERATAQVRGLAQGRNADYGLPDYLYGVEVVVEDAVTYSAQCRVRGLPARHGLSRGKHRARYDTDTRRAGGSLPPLVAEPRVSFFPEARRPARFKKKRNHAASRQATSKPPFPTMGNVPPPA